MIWSAIYIIFSSLYEKYICFSFFCPKERQKTKLSLLRNKRATLINQISPLIFAVYVVIVDFHVDVLLDFHEIPESTYTLL